MAVRVTLDFIAKEMEDNKLLFFDLKDNGKLIFSSQVNIGTSEAVKLLRDTVAGLDGDYLTVVVSNKAKKARGAEGGRDHDTREYVVRLNPEKSIGSAKGAVPVDSYLREIQDLRMQLMQQSFDRQMADLKREFEEKPSGLADQFIAAIPELVPVVLPAIFPGFKWPVKAATDTSHVVINGPPEDRLQFALNDLAECDPACVEVIEALAWVAKNNLQLYNQYRPMLLAMKK